MSRRGRGGAGIGSRMSAQNLPFDVDPDLVEAADQNFEATHQDDSAKEIFPDYGPVILAAPITDFERRQVQILRELDAKRRAGPFWTGTKEDWARIDSMSGRNAVYNPFECAHGYGKKSAKRQFRLADLTKVKLEPRFFPKELYQTIGYDPDEDLEEQPAKRQKTLGLAKKSVLDKLARFDNDNDDDQVNGDANDDESNSGANEEEGEDLEGEPEDDNFDEDDDDANNDYNAEAYFDGGEDDFEEGGGGEGGDDVF